MNDPHPHDEHLSAHLDGDPDPVVARHLDACAACRARLDALDGVRRRLAAAPAGAPAGFADRAVAAATEAWSDERATSSAGVVTPLRATGSRATRRRVPGWALGAAAAVAALVVAVPALMREDDRPSQTASAPAQDGAAEVRVDDDAVDGGDLGSLSDPATLGQELALSVPGAGASEAAGAADSLAAGTAPSAPPVAAASPESFAAPSTTAGPAARAAVPMSGALAASDAPCRREVRSEFGQGLGDLLWTASLRWQGTDAVVLAYRLADTSGGGPDFRAFVMARDGCRLLVVQGF